MEPKTPAHLESFLRERGSSATLLSFSESVHSVPEAAAAARAPPEAFIKSLAFVSADRRVVLAVIPGNRKADRAKIEAVAGCALHFASPQEALELTGYPVGGTPPLDSGAATVIVDSLVASRASDSLGGGGDDRHLLKFSSSELLRLLPGALVADVSRDGG